MESRRKRAALAAVLVVVGAVGGMAAVPDVAWAPPAGTPPAQPVLEQNLDAGGNIKVHEQGTVNVDVVDENERFSIRHLVNAGDPTHCQVVPLPSGNLVIDRVDLRFTGPADAYLVIPVVASISIPGVPEAIGRSQSLVVLEGLGQNLSSNRGRVLGLSTALFVQDGFSEDVGRLFRDAEDQVQLCAEDETPSVGHGGDLIVSGYLLR